MPDKTPASLMIRVPTALVPSIKELSNLHRQGHTKAILQKLQELIASFESFDGSTAISEPGSDSSADITESALASSKVIAEILKRLATLEDKVEAMQEEPFSDEGSRNLLAERSEKMQSHPARVLQNQQPIVPSDIIACPFCKSLKLSRWGMNKTKTKQRFKCKDCGKIFVP